MTDLFLSNKKQYPISDLRLQQQGLREAFCDTQRLGTNWGLHGYGFGMPHTVYCDTWVCP